VSPPQVTIDPTQWGTNAEIEYETVLGPLGPGSNVPLHCN
jgi:hypothetical protein